LIELLVMVSILAILTAVAIPLFTRYITKAYRGTVISDVKNAAVAVEAFISDYRNVPDSLNCPSSGYGPAVCDLTDGTNTVSRAVVVSRDVRLELSRVADCGGSPSFRIHGVHRKLSGWGFCFSACKGSQGETDGTGCP